MCVRMYETKQIPSAGGWEGTRAEGSRTGLPKKGELELCLPGSQGHHDIVRDPARHGLGVEGRGQRGSQCPKKDRAGLLCVRNRKFTK